MSGSKSCERSTKWREMAEASLSFAREEAAQEQTRLVDMGALTSSVCEDLADAGLAVTCDDTRRFCRALPSRRDETGACGTLSRMPSPTAMRARYGGMQGWRSADRYRGRRPRHTGGRYGEGLQAVRAAGAVAEQGHRRRRARPCHRAVHRSQPRRRHLAAEPPGGRLARSF